MTQEQINFLYQHKGMYHNFQTGGIIPHLSNVDAEQFLQIAKTFNPDFNTSLWCGDCVMTMIDYVYRQAEGQIAQHATEVEMPPIEPQKSKKNGKGSKA